MFFEGVVERCNVGKTDMFRYLFVCVIAGFQHAHAYSKRRRLMYLCRYSPVYDLKTMCRLRLDMAESSESLLMLFWQLNESEGSQLQSHCTIRLIWCRMVSIIVVWTIRGGPL